MRRILIALLALIALAAPAVAQSYMPVVPPNAVVVTGTSGNVANATAAVQLPAIDGQRNYLCGFSIRSLGATAAATVNLITSGLVGGQLNFSYFTIAGATTQNQPMDIIFDPCLPGAINAAVFVSLPALGAGNTNTLVNAWGYRY